MLIVSFRLGQQHYGLPIEAVREVVQLPALLALAGAGPALCGLLNLRGVYLPVLDGRVLVGEVPHYDLGNQVIMVGDDRPELGLLVDRVEGVTTGVLHTHTPFQPGMAAALLDGIIRSAQGDDLLLMNPLDLAAQVAHSRLAAESDES
jgi:purine-binding chemotaxis protein CheW